MTDYNDGNWHGWNGGECPVHPLSRIDGVEAFLGARWTADAGDNEWRSFRGAFRVTMPYVEPKKPREWWIAAIPYSHSGFMVVDRVYPNAIHVREVIE